MCCGSGEGNTSFSAPSAAPPKLLHICFNQVQNDRWVLQQIEEKAHLVSMSSESFNRKKTLGPFLRKVLHLSPCDKFLRANQLPERLAICHQD